VALTPDAVERRTFPIADWGYDRGEVHKFLVEVAATLRYARHASNYDPPPPPPPPPAAASLGVAGAEPVVALRADALELVNDDGRADARGLGQRITQILDAAETLASSIHADAEQALLVARANAEQEVATQKQEAEAEIAGLREQAKRVLSASQAKAERIVAEAEDHAASLRSAADQRAKIRNQRLQRVAEQHAERVLRFERDAVGRLKEAQDDLQQAVERLTGSEHSPVLDLSSGQPSVRVGSIEVDGPQPPEPREPVPRRRVGEHSTLRIGEESSVDAVNRMVQAAVERAAQTGAQDAQSTRSTRTSAAMPEPAAATAEPAAAPVD
jgi:DivIVA domain-containing protein